MIKILFPLPEKGWGEGSLQAYAEDFIRGVNVEKVEEDVVCSFLSVYGRFFESLIGEGEETEFRVKSGKLQDADLTGCKVTIGEGHGDLFLLIQKEEGENLVELWGV